MKKSKFFIGIISGVVLTLLVQVVYIYGFQNRSILRDINRLTASDPEAYQSDTFKDYDDKVEDVLATLDSYYMEDYDTNTLYEEGIRGLVDGIGDPYTTYFTKDEYADFMESMGGSYEGIGVVVSYGETNEDIVVVAPFKGSPGEAAGVKPGDRIIAVDGKSVIGQDVDTVVDQIRGEKGTDVVLTVMRDEEKIDISITRGTIEVPTIDSQVLDDNLGYIAMSQFDEVTADQFKEALDTLNDKQTEGLIIDLRNNPGGYLQIAYQIADMILPKDQMVVYTEDRQGNRSELITRENTSYDKPLVVLVNGNSASASEILSGAIKDHGVGTLVGTTTFGKGLVQRTFELEDGSALKITIQKYFTPNGNYIHGVGIEPDVVVEADPESETDVQLEKAKEVLHDLIDKESE